MVAVFDDYVVWRSKHCKIRNAQVKWIVPTALANVQTVMEYPQAVVVADDQAGVQLHEPYVDCVDSGCLPAPGSQGAALRGAPPL